MEIVLTLCSDYLPKAFIQYSTSNSVLPRKLWFYFIENSKGEPSDSFSEIWVYSSRESYENNESYIILQDMSQGLQSNGIKNGNLLLFKTRNESA